jgi:hypothetical protein
MIAAHLAACLAPFAQLANKHALSDVYKCIEVQPQLVRGCSQYGVLEASLSIGIPETIWIDALIFTSVLKSLPDKEEVVFVLKSGALEWECGMATGKLAIMAAQKIPLIDPASLPKDAPWTPTESFIDALELGALACGSVGMASAGVYGVVLDNRADFRIVSSDNVTVASCRVSDRVATFPERITLSPDAAAMLDTILNNDAKEAKLSIGENIVYCVNKAFRLLLRPIPAVKHDLRALTDNYASADSVAEIPRERLVAFIKRSAALSENKGQTYVTLAAAEGALSLSFAEGAASSDEYYLVKDLAVPTLPEIKLDAGRVARVLSHANEIVLDHIERKVLIFRGMNPPFLYMVAGRSE